MGKQAILIRAESDYRKSEYQRDWRGVVEPLRRNRYLVEGLESRSIHGDAPKNFIKIKEYVPGILSHRPKNWIGYIAKFGNKNYPNESITEHLMTRIGQAASCSIANSMLRMVAGQVRFLSKYFLKPEKAARNWLSVLLLKLTMLLKMPS